MYRISKNGFTIIELLIVIAIIAILVTISIVSYSGITAKSKASSLQADLTNNAKIIKLYYAEFGSYPTAINPASNCPTAPTASSNYCLKFSTGNTLDYYAGTANSFSLQATNSGISYQISDLSSSTQTPAYVTNGLVMNYDPALTSSYPGSGTSLTDISGSANNANIASTVYAFSSGNGGSLNLNGSYITTSYIPPSNDYTIEMAYMVVGSGGLWWCPFGAEVWNSATGLVVYIDGTTSDLNFRIANSSILTVPGASYNKSQFNIYTFVKSSTAGASGVYINGSSKITGTLPNTTSTVPLYFGARHSNDGLGVTDKNNEYVGFIHVYNRAINQTEVTQNYNALRGRYGI